MIVSGCRFVSPHVDSLLRRGADRLPPSHACDLPFASAQYPLHDRACPGQPIVTGATRCRRIGLVTFIRSTFSRPLHCVYLHSEPVSGDRYDLVDDEVECWHRGLRELHGVKDSCNQRAASALALERK